MPSPTPRAATSKSCWRNARSATSAPAPTRHAPTARSNASTKHSNANGPTRSNTPQATPAAPYTATLDQPLQRDSHPHRARQPATPSPRSDRPRAQHLERGDDRAQLVDHVAAEAHGRRSRRTASGPAVTIATAPPASRVDAAAARRPGRPPARSRCRAARRRPPPARSARSSAASGSSSPNRTTSGLSGAPQPQRGTPAGSAARRSRASSSATRAAAAQARAGRDRCRAPRSAPACPPGGAACRCSA